MSGFLYPRKVTVSRPKTEGSYGAVGYRGQTPPNEEVIARNLPCSIQMRGRGGLNPAHLPGDTKQTSWRLLFPLSAAAASLIQARDILTDDLGRRFQSGAPYAASMGVQLACELLEV